MANYFGFLYVSPVLTTVEFFVVETSIFEKFFQVIGKLCFPRLQKWEQCRNAKLMAIAVTLGLILGAMMILLIKNMDTIKR